jgi:hypothetical protein
MNDVGLPDSNILLGRTIRRYPKVSHQLREVARNENSSGGD